MNRAFERSAEVSRWLLGLAFVVFGLNGFLNFIPAPPPPAAGGAFLGALFATGYMFPLIKGTEVVAGILLLSGRFAALGAVVLTPVLVNIVLYHAAFDPSGLVVPLFLAALYALVVKRHWSSYAPMLGEARPSSQLAGQGTISQEAAAL